MLPQISGRPIVRDAIQNPTGQQNSKCEGGRRKLETLALLGCICDFSQCCNHMSDKGSLKKEGFSLAQGLSGGKVWHPECGVAGHSASAVRKHSGTGWMLCSAPFLLNCVTPVCKMVLPTFKMPPHSIKPLCNKPHRYAQRFVS